MTVKPVTFELRNLLGQKPADVKFTCGVCGKPHATLTKEAKELPLHKRAIAEDWAGKFRNLSRQLGGGPMILTFADRTHFNAQLEWHRDMLTQAREEHDAMPVPVKVEKGTAKTKRMLAESLKLLGVVNLPEDAGVDTLAAKVHEQLTRLMGIAAEINAAPVTEQPKAPAQVQTEIPAL